MKTKTTIFALLVGISSILLPNTCKAQIISTIAGKNGPGGYSGDGGQATAADLNNPVGRVNFDNAGNIYWADGYDGKVRKLNSAGIISSVCGNNPQIYGDGGQATDAFLYCVSDATFDNTGNMYIADNTSYRVRKINTAGIITTVAGVCNSYGYTGDGGQGTAAQLEWPNGVACDAAGNVYITSSHSVRKVNAATGIITTIAGDTTAGYSGDGGQATAAKLYFPVGVTVDAAGNIYITDSNNNVIRKINTAGIISTVVGNGFGAPSSGGFSGDGGQATAAELYRPEGGVAFDATGNMFIPDYGNNRIRMVNTAGIISTVVGNGFGAPNTGGTGGFSGDGGPPIAAELFCPSGLGFDAANNLYITDQCNHRIRKVSNDGTGITKILNINAQVSVYPNPALHTISIQVSSVTDFQNAQVVIQNTLGETIKKLSFTQNIPVAELENGCYYLQITLPNNETYQAKFIKQ